MKKVRFKVNRDDQDGSSLADNTDGVPKRFFRDTLFKVGSSTSSSGVEVEYIANEDDIDILEDYITRMTVDGILTIQFSERVHKLMEASMAITVVLKLLGRRIGLNPLPSRAYALWKPNMRVITPPPLALNKEGSWFQILLMPPIDSKINCLPLGLVSSTKVYYLKHSFKKGHFSVKGYLAKIKSTCDILSASKHDVSDEEQFTIEVPIQTNLIQQPTDSSVNSLARQNASFGFHQSSYLSRGGRGFYPGRGHNGVVIHNVSCVTSVSPIARIGQDSKCSLAYSPMSTSSIAEADDFSLNVGSASYSPTLEVSAIVPLPPIALPPTSTYHMVT
ncbi:hypothetical protein Gohar_026689, partial [Gossypium harknessii]|nr:hypothetical protein [Gossypium harknessii]